MLMDKSTREIEREIEREIVDALLTDLLAAGYRISVDDGGDLPVKAASDKAVILEALDSTGSDILLCHRGLDSEPVGWVHLVYGNSGYDVIADYTLTLEPLMQNADVISDKYAD